jgi:5-methylcytosine-specific restriction endonuclease McrA
MSGTNFGIGMTGGEVVVGPRAVGRLQRRCRGCARVLPLGWFRKAGTRAGAKRRSWTCRECRRPADALHAAVRRAAVGKFTRADVEGLFKAQRGACACGCGRSLHGGYHVDHVIPIARGGTSWPENLQLLAPSCNLAKGAR